MSETAQPSKPTTMQVGTILDDAWSHLHSPSCGVRSFAITALIGTLVLLSSLGRTSCSCARSA